MKYNLAEIENVPQVKEIARNLIKDGEIRNAEKVIRYGILAFDRPPVLMNMLGNTLARHKDSEKDIEAASCLLEAHMRCPQDNRYAVDFAKFAGRIGEHYLAEFILLSRYPQRDCGDKPRNITNTYVLAALGHHYQMGGRYQIAATCFGACLELDCEDPLALKRSAELYIRYDVEYSSGAWEAFMDYRHDFLNPMVFERS